MTETLEITGNTVTANEVLMRLDALAKGYEDVLETAKKQLETFEISSDDWNRLSDRLSRRIDYYELAGRINIRLGSALMAIEHGVPNPDSEGVARLLDQLTHRIEGRLNPVIAEIVADAVREQTRDLRQRVIQDGRLAADELIERARQSALHESEAQASALRSIMQRALGNELKTLALEAAREVATQS
jgi:transcriptional regulator with XRE-family HTH domain